MVKIYVQISVQYQQMESILWVYYLMKNNSTYIVNISYLKFKMKLKSQLSALM